MPSYLITGASRGLGLGFTTELLKDPSNTVIATARNTASSTGLQALKAADKNQKLHLIDMDVSNAESVHKAAKEATTLLPEGLDHLVSSAGVNLNGLKSFEEIDIADLTAELNFTVTAPIYLLREFLPLVRKGQAKRVVIISSVLGSVQLGAAMPGLANGYCIARAALNMLARKWAPVLKGEGVTLATLHPGWVGVTEIGDGIAAWIEKYNPSLENLTVERSAADCMKVLNGLTLEQSGAFLNHDGSALPF